MQTIFYTFYNSKYDIDYYLNTKYFNLLIIFYCYSPPKRYFGSPILIKTKDIADLKNKNDYVISRLIKFSPWNYMENKFSKYVYFDYRIKLSRKSILYAQKSEYSCFFKHREGGILRDEIIRILSRDKSSVKSIRDYLNIKKLNINLPITENGVMILTKDLENSFHQMSSMYNTVKRDQILTPIFLQNHKINYFEFNLSNLSFLYVRPKVLNFINLLKLFYRELLFTFIWNR